MTQCIHRRLTLLPGEKHRLQCRYCHLTISEDELEEGYCPECYESEGWKRYDFDPVAPENLAETRYRCEECNIIISYRDGYGPVTLDPEPME